MDDLTNVEGFSFRKDVGEAKKKVELQKGEWYLADLLTITPYEGVWQGTKTLRLRWMFALVGEQFELEYEGTKYQMPVYGKTTRSCSSDPRNAMWKYITSILGIDESNYESYTSQFDTIPEMLKEVIGKKCYVMVNPKLGKDKNGKDKIYNDVIMIKKYDAPKVASSSQPAISKPVATPKVEKEHIVQKVDKKIESKNPGKVVDPLDIKSELDGEDVFKDLDLS